LGRENLNRNLLDIHLFREIFEQPQVLERLLTDERQAIKELAAAISGRKVTNVLIAARGTSDNAGRYAQYLLGAKNRMVVALATPSLFTIYQRPPRLTNSLVLGISQSGKSPDIVAVLAEAHLQKALTAVITNEPDSELAKQADHVINLRAGVERSVAATKTYTSELGAIALLSASLANSPQMYAAIEKIPDVLAKTMVLERRIAVIAPRYRYMRQCVVIGRGYNYATAFEIALKLKELTYTLVEPYSSADFLHGPLAMVEPGFPVIVVAPRGKMINEMMGFVETLVRRGAEVIVISDYKSLLQNATVPLKLPASVPEWLSPISAILPGQLFALYLALERGYDPDQPRSLHKVTETR